jgi:hypothetical protein
MREVKEICEELLAEPGPPQVGPAQMLGLARRARQRRTRAWLLGCSGLLLVASLGIIPASVVPTQTPAASPSTSPSTSPTPSVLRPGRDDPTLVRMFAALEAAIPPNYTVVSYSAGKSHSLDPDDPYRTFEVGVELTGQAGMSVHLFREPVNPVFRKDPCRIELMRYLGVGPADRCEVKTVSGQRIGVGNLKREPESWFAVRHDGDWTILTFQTAGLMPTDEMARLILDPRIAPA